METLHFNLSEEEFSKGRKVLLWTFSSLFFIASLYVLMANLAFGHKSIPLFIALITFGISLFVGIIAAFASIRRKDLFFTVDNEKIEFRYGILKARKHTFKWVDIKELILPQKQKKAAILLNDGSSYLINLNWLQKKKSSLIRKYIYIHAKEKNLRVVKVPMIRSSMLP
jgi:membrane protein YdbS with pleckstrin-like domain